MHGERLKGGSDALSGLPGDIKQNSLFIVGGCNLVIKISMLRPALPTFISTRVSTGKTAPFATASLRKSDSAIPIRG
jgi:hypothetical protein